jgi:hypothetical protein
MPIPQADPKALAWMQAEQNVPRPKESLFHRGRGMLRNGPDMDASAHSGPPQMEPESDTSPWADVLNGNRATGTGAGKTGLVLTVKPGEDAPSGGTPAGASTEDVNTTSTSDSTNTGTSATDPPAAKSPDTAPPAATDGTVPGTDPAAADAAKTDTSTPTPEATNQKESSSKKKGLRKLIPW